MGHAQTYRGENEVENIRKEKDCLMLFRQRVTQAGLVDESELDRIDQEVADYIDECVREAKEAPEPTPDQLTTDVYVSY